jgi:acetylglutamate kinase
LGLSGVDGSLVQGTAADPALGYVGTVTGVDLSPLRTVMAGGFIPVVATVGVDPNAAAPPRLLNFNADTVAGELARALGASRLMFLTDVPGVMDAAKQVLDHLGPAEARELIRSGAAGGGMIPKIEACLQARSAGTECWITDGRKPNALLEALGSAPSGTRIW